MPDLNQMLIEYRGKDLWLCSGSPPSSGLPLLANKVSEHALSATGGSVANDQITFPRSEVAGAIAQLDATPSYAAVVNGATLLGMHNVLTNSSTLNGGSNLAINAGDYVRPSVVLSDQVGTVVTGMTPQEMLDQIASGPEVVMAGIPSANDYDEQFFYNMTAAFNQSSGLTPAQLVQGANLYPNVNYSESNNVYSGQVYQILKPWWIIAPATGQAHTSNNCGIKIFDERLFTLLFGANAFQQILSGNNFNRYEATTPSQVIIPGSAANLETRLESDGIVIKVPAGYSGKVIHGEHRQGGGGQDYVSTDMANTEGIMHALSAQLVPFDTNLSLNEANCNVALYMGCDAVPNTSFSGVNPGLFASGMKRITSTPRTLVMANVDHIRNDSNNTPKTAAMTTQRFLETAPTL